MSDSVVSGPEYAVIVPPEEVPASVLEPAERAAKIVRGKATKSVRVYYARPELAEEAIDRIRFERENEELLGNQARELGLTVPEVAFLQLSRIPEAEGARVDLAGARSLFMPPDMVVVRATDTTGEDEAERERLRESVAFAVALVFREALWDIVGMERLLRRKKLKSTDRKTDTMLYARDVVSTGAPW
jgi:hypothetical protein